MINIDKSSLFGKGHHRECYRHPDTNNLCIKITTDGNLSAKQDKREKQYYKSLERRGVSWDMIPAYHGDIQTNLGIGSIYDLVLDEEGTVSKTLEHYLATTEETEANYDGLLNSLHKLKEYLLKYRIITMTLAPRNISCQRDKSGIVRLVIVDNIGNSDFFSICNYSKRMAMRKISRRWKRFEDRILNTYSHNKALQRMLQQAKSR